MFAGYKFKNKALFELARTHTSYANEHRNTGLISNQRLEFLGDSVLSLMVSEYIYKNCPKFREGDLSKIRADVVCENSLFELARQITLGNDLRLGRGEDNEIGRSRPSTLSDAFEAMVAAMYLDSDFETAKSVLMPLLEPKILMSINNHESKDYKTTLQEVVQKKGKAVIRYKTVDESGPDHNKTYTIRVFVNEKLMGEGAGHSKKSAEQEAAKQAVLKLKNSKKNDV